MSENEIVRLVPQGLSLEYIQNTLPNELAASLERSWLDGYKFNDEQIVEPIVGNIRAEARFLQITEIAKKVGLSNQVCLGNMQNVISSLRDGSHSMVYSVQSDGKKVNLYAGVRKFSIENKVDTYIKVLNKALRSNFPGIVLSIDGVDADPYPRLSTESVLEPIHSMQYLGCITGIPSLRKADFSSGDFSQSIDRFVEALRGEKYVLLIIAEPIPDDKLKKLTQNLRDLGTEIHTMVKNSVSVSENKTLTNGSSKSIGAGTLISAIVSVGGGLSKSTSLSRGLSVSKESLDKTAQYCEQHIDHYMQRIQDGRSLGFWNVGIYILSDDSSTFLRAQSIARSLYSGEHTYYEPIRVVDLSYSTPVKESIANFRLPKLGNLVNQEGEKVSHPLGELYQSLGTPLTTEELSILVSFPTREVPGMKLKTVADFNLNPPGQEGAEIGSLLYYGEKLGRRISISSNSLTRHTFVTGLTGSGKTNTCLALLDDAYKKHGQKFLVIDPAKTEYRFLLNSNILGKDLMVFTLGDESLSPFRLNPFEFIRGFPLLSHIDLIKAVFNSAFPMYASMPYLLEEAVLDIYQERGWDISTTTNCFIKGDIADPKIDYAPFIPRLSDLYAKIDGVVARKRYDAKIAQDLTAALKARLGSLLHGGKGLMLDTQRSINLETLLEKPVILELRRAGDDDERAFLMALIFVMLYETCQNRKIRKELQHVTLIEEAHRLLRNIPTSVSMESANPRGKTVEMFTDMMAEMRAMGEGFIIVDQMPNKLVPDVIKGSNLKIVHRLMAHDDRLSVGNAMGMNDSQIDYLPRLKKGEAIIHSEELEEACLVMIDSVEDRLAITHSDKEQFLGLCPDDELMKKRSKEFFQQFPEVLYKYNACTLCSSPCNFYVGEDSRILTENLVGIGAANIANIALASPQASQASWARLQKEADILLHDFFGVKLQANHKKCLMILLAAHSSRNFAENYSQAGKWDGVLNLQMALAASWIQPSASLEDMDRIRRIILDQIATRPAIPKIGCTACVSRCWFGFMFQAKNNALVVTLKDKIRVGLPVQRISAAKITDYIKQQLGQQLDLDLIYGAGYCLLTQCTDNEKALSDFQSQMKSG